jgi:hypothetical protein
MNKEQKIELLESEISRLKKLYMKEVYARLWLQRQIWEQDE